MGVDSCLRGHQFESRHWRDNFSHFCKMFNSRPVVMGVDSCLRGSLSRGTEGLIYYSYLL